MGKAERRSCPERGHGRILSHRKVHYPHYLPRHRFCRHISGGVSGAPAAAEEDMSAGEVEARVQAMVHARLLAERREAAEEEAIRSAAEARVQSELLEEQLTVRRLQGTLAPKDLKP